MEGDIRYYKKERLKQNLIKIEAKLADAIETMHTAAAAYTEAEAALHEIQREMEALWLLMEEQE